jgi:tetratricopeptide (TPR) repeat protein
MKVKMKSLLVAISLLIASVANGQTVQDGMAQLDGDKPGKAKATFEGLVASAPTADNYFYLGYYNLRSGNFDAAKAAFEKGATVDPKNPMNAIGQGAILVANKNLTGAKAIFDKIILDTKSKNADVLFRIAEAYTMFYDVNKPEEFNKGNNDPGEAIRIIETIVEKTKKPLTVEMNIVKGDAFLIKNDGGPAVTAYEQSILVNKTAKAYTRIGVVYLRGKNYQQTVNSYKTAMDTDSNFAPIYKRMGEYFIIFSQYKNASKQFRKYVEKAEATPKVLLETAKLLFLSKDYTGSMEFTKQAEAGGIKDNDIMRMKGWSNVELGSPQLGIESLEQLLKSGVKPILLDYVYLGRGYQALKKDSLAILNYEIAAPQDTNNNHYNSIHDLLFTAKKYETAATYGLKSIDWKKTKKQQISSGDWSKVATDYYYTAAYMAKDTINRPAMAVKADSTFAKAIAINGNWPVFQLFRARNNTMIDYNGTLWLAAPHYEKFLAAVDFQKADAKSQYKENKENNYEALKYLVGYNVYLTKDLVKAQEYANKAVEIKADDPDQLKALLTVGTTPTTTTTTTPATGGTKPPKK